MNIFSDIDIETIMKLGNVSHDVAVIALQHARGNVGFALNNLPGEIHSFKKEAVYG